MLIVPPRCGIPASAKAVAINMTVVESTRPGDLRAYPAGAARTMQALRFAAGQARSSNAVLGLAFDGSGGLAFRASLFGDAGGTVHLIVDVVGYFE